MSIIIIRLILNRILLLISRITISLIWLQSLLQWRLLLLIFLKDFEIGRITSRVRLFITLIKHQLLIFELLLDSRRSKHRLLGGWLVKLVHLSRHHFPSLVGWDWSFLGGLIQILFVTTPGVCRCRNSLLSFGRQFRLLRLIFLNILNGERFWPRSIFKMVLCILWSLSLSIFFILQLLRESLHFRIVSLFNIIKILRVINGRGTNRVPVRGCF